MPRRKEGDNKPRYSKETAIVKHSNHLAEIPLQKFTARDVDLFFGLLFKLQGNDSNRVVIGFEELRGLIGYTETSNARMIKDLKEMSFKFSNINLIEQHDEFNFKIVIPFIDFEVNSKEGTFTVGVHPDFAAAINELDGSPGKRYTLSDVVGIARMKSVYAKQCLKMIYVYRNTGAWYVTVNGLRKALDVPASYKTNDVKKRVIDVILKEFSESDLFEFFEIIERRSEKKAKGRPSVEGYTFFFRFRQDAAINQYADGSEGNEIICPMCKRPLKKIARKDGTGYFYGHPDWRQENAPCQYTFSPKDVEQEESPEAADEEDVNVTTAELRRYYEHISDEEEKAASERRTEIKENEPKVWELYERREEAFIEFINMVSSLRPLSESGREEWQESKAEAKKNRDESIKALEEALQEKGYSKDYMDRRYRCEKCLDSGTTKDGLNCECRKERVVEAAEWLKK